MGRAWVFNLDVERELAHGPRAALSPKAQAALGRAIPQAAAGLLRAGDVLVGEGQRAEGYRGQAWCPSPGSLQQLVEAGASLPLSPGLGVLARVNRSDFCVGVLDTAHGFGKRVCGTLQELQELLADNPAHARLVRRAFGAAGRGRRRFGGRGATLEEEDSGLTWMRASLLQGPLVVEPWVEVLREFAWHGWLEPGSGKLHMGQPCVQTVDAHGAWSESRRALRGDLEPGEEAALGEALAASGVSLAAAGYFGPFGVDGFRYRLHCDRAQRFQPLGDLNARLSMGWSEGMGARGVEEWLGAQE